MVQPNQTDWVATIPLVEFTMNSNLSSSTSFTPFKLNYGFMPTLISGITPMEKVKSRVQKFVNQAIVNLKTAHDAIIKSCITQMYQANKK